MESCRCMVLWESLERSHTRCCLPAHTSKPERHGYRSSLAVPSSLCYMCMLWLALSGSLTCDRYTGCANSCRP